VVFVVVLGFYCLVWVDVGLVCGFFWVSGVVVGWWFPGCLVVAGGCGLGGWLVWWWLSGGWLWVTGSWVEFWLATGFSVGGG